MPNHDTEPARPTKLHVDVRQTPGRLELVRTGCEFYWRIGCVLCLFFVGWSLGCLITLAAVIAVPFPIVTYPLAAVFWVLWMGLIFGIIDFFFGRERFSLDSDGANYRRSVSFLPIRSRRVPVEEIERFSICSYIKDHENGTEEWGIEMHTPGKNLKFMYGRPGQGPLWLEWQLNHLLRELQKLGDESADSLDKDKSPTEAETQQEPRGCVDVVELQQEPRKPPEGCRWRKSDEFDSVQLIRHGLPKIATVPVWLVINAFVIGAGAFFILPILFGRAEGVPDGFGRYGVYLFMICYAALGALLFLCLLADLTAPMQQIIWRLGKNSIERRRILMGVGPRRSFPVDSVGRIEIRRDSQETKVAKGLVDVESPSDSDSEVDIVLVDKENTEVCTIGNLTEGEARWIADVILREREAWFR